jgi:hypothetical protein
MARYVHPRGTVRRAAKQADDLSPIGCSTPDLCPRGTASLRWFRPQSVSACKFLGSYRVSCWRSSVGLSWASWHPIGRGLTARSSPDTKFHNGRHDLSRNLFVTASRFLHRRRAPRPAVLTPRFVELRVGFSCRLTATADEADHATMPYRRWEYQQVTQQEPVFALTNAMTYHEKQPGPASCRRPASFRPWRRGPGRRIIPIRIARYFDARTSSIIGTNNHYG